VSKIIAVKAREVLDSRGTPTVEAEVHGPGGIVGRAIAPSGASTGRHEAVERRDGDPRRFAGRGALSAVRAIHETIAPALIGQTFLDQESIDRALIELDGTPNFANLGANAVLAVSLATAHAAARLKGLPLWRSLADLEPSMPLPMVNMISGGLHAGRQIEFQDFLAIPVGATSFHQAIEWIADVSRALKSLLEERGLEAALVADEGGFGPKLPNNQSAIELLATAIERTGHDPGREVAIGVDVASSHFYRDESYWLRDGADDPTPRSAGAMIELFQHWTERFPLISIEDGLAEDDWEGWRALTATLGSRAQLIGDDFLTTRPERLARAIHESCGNAILIKPNQIGTLTQTLSVLRQARRAGYASIVSARSGETEDTTIADLAIATGAGQIKIGAIARGERLAKYNQLLRIEEQTGSELPFVGRKALAPLSPR
jgi:enolase